MFSSPSGSLFFLTGKHRAILYTDKEVFVPFGVFIFLNNQESIMYKMVKCFRPLRGLYFS